MVLFVLEGLKLRWGLIVEVAESEEIKREVATLYLVLGT